MVRVLFFLTRFHVNVARSNGNQHGAPKINACVLCVRVLRLISTDAFLATHVNAHNFLITQTKKRQYIKC